jgi:hypothetical protein
VDITGSEMASVKVIYENDLSLFIVSTLFLPHEIAAQ